MGLVEKRGNDFFHHRRLLNLGYLETNMVIRGCEVGLLSMSFYLHLPVSARGSGERSAKEREEEIPGQHETPA